MSVEREISPQVYLAFKNRVLTDLVQELDEKFMEKTDQASLRLRVETLVEQKIHDEKLPFSRAVRLSLITDIADELLGYGPLEAPLRDQTITEIMINGPQVVYVERNGKIERAAIHFRDEAHLRQVIDRIVTPLGRRIDESSPMVDARLPDGSRVNAIIPPLALDGSVLTIRKFGKHRLTPDDLVRLGSITPQMVAFVAACVRIKLNVLVSGGTGSGKTTLLNVLSSFIPPGERIVTIEDAAELRLQQPHCVRLEARPANIEGKGLIGIRDLVRNALRMRPDRIVVGECRGGEALDMLQAMNTGHDGSLTTLHANTPRDCTSRLETMVMMAGMELPSRAIREQIASAIQLIVQVARLSDGSRKVISVTEVQGMEGQVITLQDLFVFRQTNVDAQGRVVGQMESTGLLPKFYHRFATAGINLPAEIFQRPGGND
ncbi:MAG: CpaF family protein [Verrucomicrobia bacterium]|nr:CpaF family protein [Verrucomicrobiota bacterium]